MENLYQKYQPVLVPVAVLLVSLTMVLYSGSVLWSRLGGLNKKISVARESVGALESRYNKLREVSREVTLYSENSLWALPVDNSALSVVAQIRKLAAEQDLLVENLSLEGYSQGNELELSRFDLSFKMKGSYPQISSFLNKLSKVMPLININSVRIDAKSFQELSAQIIISSFWTALPKELPAISGPVTELTTEELATLNTISSFERPTLLNSIDGGETLLPRPNPFIP